MAYSFSNANWADEIAVETEKPDYQNIDVRIFDESQATLVQEYDVVTGTGPIYEGGDIYTGRARLIGVRWGVQHGGGSQANAYTEKAIRIQVPFQAVGRVKKGCQVFITSSPRNPVLEELSFTVTSDLQGSMSASRTLECSLNGDVEVSV